jgi:hypothetical protein
MTAFMEVFDEEFATGRVIGSDTGKPWYFIHDCDDGETLLANPFGHRVAGRSIVDNAVHTAIEDGIIGIFNRGVIRMTVKQQIVANLTAAILQSAKYLSDPWIGSREAFMARGKTQNLC